MLRMPTSIMGCTYFFIALYINQKNNFKWLTVRSIVQAAVYKKIVIGVDFIKINIDKVWKKW